MKINESTLISYATSANSPTDKQGFLWKRGEVNRSFQKRYFVLKGNLLFYFEKRHDKEPVGVVIMEGCTIELAEEEQEMFAFKINFHGEGRRIYYLGTDSQEMLEEWMKCLAAASYDYMKLMVMELQQKVRELEEMEQLGPVQPLSVPSSSQVNTDNSVMQQRANPFNKDTNDAPQQQPKPNAKSSWALIHVQYGQKIMSDRDKWCLRLLQT